MFIYDCVCMSEHVSWSFLFSLFIFRNNPRWRTNFRDGHFITVLLDDVVGELSLEVSPQYFPSTRSAEPLTRQLLSTPIRSPPPYLQYTHPPPPPTPPHRPSSALSLSNGRWTPLSLLRLFHTRAQEWGWGCYVGVSSFCQYCIVIRFSSW